jgi:hypothetical protein
MTEEETPQEETLFAGKYKSVEDLEQGYKELQSKLGSETPEVEPEDPRAWRNQLTELYQDGALTDPEKAAEIAGQFGLDLEDLEVWQLGHEARRSKQEQELLSMVGGREGWEEVSQWASATQSEEQLAALNEVLAGSDVNAAKMAILETFAAFKSATGTEASRRPVQGAPSANAPVEAYTDRQTLARDMASAQYQNDPAFRAEVQKRWMASQQ